MKVSGMLLRNHVSVKTMKQDSRFSQQTPTFKRSSSVLFFSERELLRSKDGGGSLAALQMCNSAFTFPAC